MADSKEQQLTWLNADIYERLLHLSQPCCNLCDSREIICAGKSSCMILMQDQLDTCIQMLWQWIYFVPGLHSE